MDDLLIVERLLGAEEHREECEWKSMLAHSAGDNVRTREALRYVWLRARPSDHALDAYNTFVETRLATILKDGIECDLVSSSQQCSIRCVNAYLGQPDFACLGDALERNTVPYTRPIMLRLKITHASEGVTYSTERDFRAWDLPVMVGSDACTGAYAGAYNEASGETAEPLRVHGMYVLGQHMYAPVATTDFGSTPHVMLRDTQKQLEVVKWKTSYGTYNLRFCRLQLSDNSVEAVCPDMADRRSMSVWALFRLFNVCSLEDLSEYVTLTSCVSATKVTQQLHASDDTVVAYMRAAGRQLQDKSAFELQEYYQWRLFPFLGAVVDREKFLRTLGLAADMVMRPRGKCSLDEVRYTAVHHLETILSTDCAQALCAKMYTYKGNRKRFVVENVFRFIEDTLRSTRECIVEHYSRMEIQSKSVVDDTPVFCKMVTHKDPGGVIVENVFNPSSPDYRHGCEGRISLVHVTKGAKRDGIRASASLALGCKLSCDHVEAVTRELTGRTGDGDLDVFVGMRYIGKWTRVAFNAWAAGVRLRMPTVSHAEVHGRIVVHADAGRLLRACVNDKVWGQQVASREWATIVHETNGNPRAIVARLEALGALQYLTCAQEQHMLGESHSDIHPTFALFDRHSPASHLETCAQTRTLATTKMISQASNNVSGLFPSYTASFDDADWLTGTNVMRACFLNLNTTEDCVMVNQRCPGPPPMYRQVLLSAKACADMGSLTAYFEVEKRLGRVGEYEYGCLKVGSRVTTGDTVIVTGCVNKSGVFEPERVRYTHHNPGVVTDVLVREGDIIVYILEELPYAVGKKVTWAGTAKGVIALGEIPYRFSDGSEPAICISKHGMYSRQATNVMKTVFHSMDTSASALEARKTLIHTGVLCKIRVENGFPIMTPNYNVPLQKPTFLHRHFTDNGMLSNGVHQVGYLNGSESSGGGVKADWQMAIFMTDVQRRMLLQSDFTWFAFTDCGYPAVKKGEKFICPVHLSHRCHARLVWMSTATAFLIVQRMLCVNIRTRMDLRPV